MDRKIASKMFAKMFKEQEDLILRLANHYKFYPAEIFSTMLAIKKFKYGTYKNKTPEIELIVIEENIVGFYIKGYCQKSGSCMLEFIFIIPEYRRNGIFTNFIQNLKKEEDDIWIATDKPEMIRGLNKLGFKCNGKCKNNRELSFSWKK